jgi:hypothetical protein
VNKSVRMFAPFEIQQKLILRLPTQNLSAVR